MYKPYLQFDSDGTKCSCIRKILSISGIKYIPYEDNEYSQYEYCIVQTADEFFNGKPLENRRAEQMVAFGACAHYLQYVNYVDNNIVLSWFVNDKKQSVIFAFSEIKKENCSPTIAPCYISKYERNFAHSGSYADMPMEPYSGVLYYGRKYYPATERSCCCYRGNWVAHDFTVTQVINEFLELKDNEAIDLAKITAHGDFKKYKWFIIRKGDIETLKDALELKELKVSL